MAPHYSYRVDKKFTGNPKPKFVMAANSTPSALSKKMVKNYTSNKSERPRRLHRVWKSINGRKRLISAVAITAAVLLAASYVSYLNIPSVSLKVAAVRAGVDAQLPRYRPAGYSFSGPVANKQGKVIVRFTSADSPAVLTLTEEKTDWDPATLLEAYVQPRSQCEELYSQCINENRLNGLRVYIFNGDQAAWINNGVLYTIEGTYELATDEVLSMATSL